MITDGVDFEKAERLFIKIKDPILCSRAVQNFPRSKNREELIQTIMSSHNTYHTMLMLPYAEGMQRLQILYVLAYADDSQGLIEKLFKQNYSLTDKEKEILLSNISEERANSIRRNEEAKKMLEESNILKIKLYERMNVKEL